MALTILEPDFPRLDPAELAAWGQIPAAIIGDELNRAQCMAGRMKPLAGDIAFAGQALTAQTMVGDNVTLHYAMTQAWPGAVLVADARAHLDTAVFGEILFTNAKSRGFRAIVIDGAVRDSAALAKDRDCPVFCCGAVPQGPHKGFGGTINGPISCAGVAVDPGDLIVGDDDGIVVVRPGQRDGLLARCRARLANEDVIMDRIRAGEDTVTIQNMPPADKVGS